MRIHGQVRYGPLATLNLLDCRQHKSPLACTRDGRPGSSTVDPATCPQWQDPARSMLGAAQERWLHEALGAGASPRGWNLIGQASLLGPLDFKPGPAQRFWNDGWDGYSPARQRLLDSLQSQRIGGDMHENWVGQVKADYTKPRSANLGVEFCGTAITSRSGGNGRTAERLAENPHFVYADAERKGYGLIDLTPDSMQVTLRVVDDVTARGSGISTLAQFRVDGGRAVVERVGS
jgi:alkaline phosphatase D